MTKTQKKQFKDAQRAFWQYTSRFNNVPIKFNEVDLNTNEQKRIQAFKQMSDKQEGLI
ncbi:hypothetical protein [Mucilaginibacter sp.]|uniref:hypothetical protein n=1 Tax=Mucilaginibacter sp. TaxID=1882438 RepID=UPI00261F11D8|nr:hypothetical protein [Mucilaginibacter sp.]MDB4920779.1 hypothetical protein [Mucilaginibacter sp.]